MTPEQESQVKAVQARIRILRMGGASLNMIPPTLRKEGYPEAAIIKAFEGTEV